MELRKDIGRWRGGWKIQGVVRCGGVGLCLGVVLGKLYCAFVKARLTFSFILYILSLFAIILFKDSLKFTISFKIRKWMFKPECAKYSVLN